MSWSTDDQPLSRPYLRLATICIDCADADAMADFYGRLLGWEVALREPDWVLMPDPAGGTGLSFQAEAEYREPVWPEQPDGQDKMLHLDIHVDDLDSAVAHALASGARLAEQQPQAGVRVLLDPAGHPFCLFLD
jgi:catechol 2,3-dioxygenase-like lactoylglutathione lyase family enzyme